MWLQLYFLWQVHITTYYWSGTEVKQLQDHHVTGVSAGPGLGCVGVLSATKIFYSERFVHRSLLRTDTQPYFLRCGLSQSRVRDGESCSQTALVDELSSLALTMLSVVIADGLLIHQTWVAIAPIAGIGPVNFGRKSLLQVLYRNGKPYIADSSCKILGSNPAQKSVTSCRSSLIVPHAYTSSSMLILVHKHHHWNPHIRIRRRGDCGNAFHFH